MLYDQTALDASWDLCRDWSEDERQYIRVETPKTALYTPFRGRTVLDVSREVLEIAEAGLKRRGQMNGIGEDETIFLSELKEIVGSGKTRARQMLDAYESRWDGDINRVFMEMSY